MKTIVFLLLLICSYANVYDTAKNTTSNQYAAGENDLSNSPQSIFADTLPLGTKAFLQNFKTLALPIILEDSMFWNRKKIPGQEVQNLTTCLGNQKKSGVFEYGWSYNANQKVNCLIYTRAIESVNEDVISEVILATIDTLGKCISSIIMGYYSDSRSCKIQVDKTKILLAQYQHIPENHELVAVDIEDYEFTITPEGIIKKRLITPKYRKPAKIMPNSKGRAVMKILW